MKTGFNLVQAQGCSLAGLLLILSATTLPARAADLPVAPPPAMPMPAMPAAAMPVASMPAPVTEPMPVLPAASPALPVAEPTPIPTNGKESMATLENNVKDQARAAVKRFNSSANDVNLDDLNTARMAIAKIDALIDIEKHLAELDKIRAEREGKGSLASAIPASALALPGNMAMPRNDMAMLPMATTRTEPPVAARHANHKTETSETAPDESSGMSMSAGNGNGTGSGTSISRITGANGNYTAMIRMNGQDKTVRIGDHLPDGSAVVNITPTSVALMRNNAVRQIRVDGIEVVNGHSY